MDIQNNIVFISNNNRQHGVLIILTNKVTVMVISMVTLIVIYTVTILIIKDNHIVIIIIEGITTT